MIPIRVGDGPVHFRWHRLRKAIDHAVMRGCHVISMSMGGPIEGPSLHEAIRRANDRGIILIAAAGNTWPFVAYPGRYDEVICAAATTVQRTPWPRTAKGADVDVAAPGHQVWRALADDNGTFTIAESSGTSYAAAIVAGIAALWLALHGRQRLINRYGARNLSAVFKEVVMRAGVTVPGGWEPRRMGAGIIDAEMVLRAPLPGSAVAGGIGAVRPPAAPAVVAAEAAGVAPEVAPGRPAAQPRTESDFDELAHYVPDVPRTVLRANLMELLGSSDATLDDDLARLGAELKMHAAMNPEIRARLSGGVAARAEAEARVAVAAAGAAPVMATRAMLSPELRARVQ